MDYEELKTVASPFDTKGKRRRGEGGGRELENEGGE